MGGIPGSLVHFLSDSQSCAHWYLHVLPNGEVGVLELEDLYCYKVEHSEWIENPCTDYKGGSCSATSTMATR